MFNKLREKTGKQFVKKYQYPFGPIELEQNYIGNGYHKSAVTGQIMNINQPIQQLSPDEEADAVLSGATRPSATLSTGPGDTTDLRSLAGGFVKSAAGQDTSSLTGDAAKGATMATNMETNAKEHTKSAEKAQRAADLANGFGGKADGTIGSAIGNVASGNWKTGLVDTAVAGIKAVDNLAMGDKNFGSQSQAIDQSVHAASSALMKSGNPYCVCKGTRVVTSAGEFKNIEDLCRHEGIVGYQNNQIAVENIEYMFPPVFKECVQIETTKGNILRCSLDHPILSALEGKGKCVKKGNKRVHIKNFSFRDASTLKIGDYVAEIGEIPIFGQKSVKDAYLIGLLIGDGTYRKRSVPLLTTVDPDTWNYVENNTSGKLKRIDFTQTGKEVRYYGFNGYQSVLREYGIFGQTRKSKRLPNNIHEWDKESCAKLIAGLIDTDGYVMDSDSKHCGIFFTQSNLELVKQIKELLLKFGIHSTIITQPEGYSAFGDGKQYFCKEMYVLCIKTKESVINFYNNITLNISYKQKKLHNTYLIKYSKGTKDRSYDFLGLVADKIRSITPIGVCQVFNIQTSNSHTYVANNIVTHNCMLAGAALEGANFLTKAGGQTVQGFDVDINSSGYGDLGHMESSSSRDFGAMIGLGGIFGRKKLQRKLQKRNEQALMAMNAANIAEDQAFEQEARMNSIQNTIMNNQMALAGGLDTSLLGG